MADFNKLIKNDNKLITNACRRWRFQKSRRLDGKFPERWLLFSTAETDVTSENLRRQNSAWSYMQITSHHIKPALRLICKSVLFFWQNFCLLVRRRRSARPFAPLSTQVRKRFKNVISHEGCEPPSRGHTSRARKHKHTLYMINTKHGKRLYSR